VDLAGAGAGATTAATSPKTEAGMGLGGSTLGSTRAGPEARVAGGGDGATGSDAGSASSDNAERGTSSKRGEGNVQ
jgi:hypothetical protein